MECVLRIFAAVQFQFVLKRKCGYSIQGSKKHIFLNYENNKVFNEDWFYI